MAGAEVVVAVSSTVGTENMIMPCSSPTTETLGARVSRIRSLGIKDEALLELLHKAVSQYPVLLDAPKKFSSRFAKTALSTLAELLAFLETNSALDMNSEAKKHFDELCQNVEGLGFDKAWLDSVRGRANAKMDFDLEGTMAEITRLEERKLELSKELNDIDSKIKELYLLLDSRASPFGF